MAYVNTYLRSDALYVCPQAQTTSGFYILNGSVSVVDFKDERSIKKALIKSKEEFSLGVPPPLKWGGLFEPVLRAAGIKTESAFTKSAKLVGIKFNEAHLELTPSSKRSLEGGYSFLFDHTIRTTIGSPGFYGALVEAFSISD